MVGGVDVLDRCWKVWPTAIDSQIIPYFLAMEQFYLSQHFSITISISEQECLTDISIIQYSLSFDGHRPPYFFQREEFPISIKPTKIQSIWIQIAREGRKGSLMMHTSTGSLRKPSEPATNRLTAITWNLKLGTTLTKESKLTIT
jgi:hypothetical protein